MIKDRGEVNECNLTENKTNGFFIRVYSVPSSYFKTSNIKLSKAKKPQILFPNQK